MTRSSSFLSVAALAASSLLVACGGDDGDPHVVTHDAAMGSGSADAPVSGGCLAESSYAPAFTADDQFAVEYPEDAKNELPHELMYIGLLDQNTTPDELYIDLFDGYGPFANGFATGQFPLAGDDTKWSSCGACVYIAADVADNGEGDPADFYFAQSGVLELTSVAGNITGTLSNVAFSRVGLNENGWAGDEAIGDCTSNVASASFDIDITPYMAATGKGARVRLHAKRTH